MEEGCDTALLHTQGCTLNQGHRRASRELRRARGAATALQPHTAPRVLSACTRRPRTGPKVWGPIPAPGIHRPTATIPRVPAQPCGARGGRGVAVRAGTTLSTPVPAVPHTHPVPICALGAVAEGEGGRHTDGTAGRQSGPSGNPKPRQGKAAAAPGAAPQPSVRHHRGAAPVPARHRGGVIAPGVFRAAPSCIYTTR